ncbi:MAG: hypothetical protein ACLTSK_04485 [Christensenellales bacterium]
MDSDSADIFEETFRKNGYSANTVNSHSFVVKRTEFSCTSIFLQKLTDQALSPH